MDAVENIDTNSLVRIGFGKREHGAALMTAGAEKVFWHPDELDIITHRGGLREGDVLLVADPKILSISQYAQAKEACMGDLLFQVAGHDPVALTDARDFSEFRKIKASAKSQVPISEPAGRPAKIKYTVEQADAIIRLWHEVPRRKPAEILLLADKILGKPDGTVQHHWVRDLVRKYVGTAQRDKPAGWRGVRID